MIRRNAYRAVCCLAPLALVFCVPTQAQYPGKSIRLIVPATAGDGSDILARALGQELGARMGQPIVIDNRPGAGGSIASDLVAKAPADGYTLLLGNGSSHGVTPGLYPKLPYDSVRDFAPITLIATAANALVVSAALAANSPAELIALARAKPGRLNIASAGSGSLSHLSGELFKSMAGIDMVHIPYRGATPALADLAGGDIAAMVINIPTILPLARAGKIRAIATTGARRATALPDVPTLAESG
ncbi:MAG: tripartite tricarboxylate transporter substrate-binding protein, partial [Burkholderiales bacterium]